MTFAVKTKKGGFAPPFRTTLQFGQGRDPRPAPRYGFTPPNWQTIFHSAGVTGCTDRRDNFTSAMSFSRGSARTAANVTGVLSGVTALTSTTTHGSPALAVGSGELSRTTSAMPTTALSSPEW